MFEIIIGTTNPGKTARYDAIVSNFDARVVIPPRKLDVEEDGSGIENAKKKALAYCKEYRKPALGIDEELYLNFLSEEEQPGPNVRRFQGRTLSDEELREIFLKRIKSAPVEKRNGYFIHNICLAMPSGIVYSVSHKEDLWFTDQPATSWNPGYPLGSLHYRPEFGKHSSLLTEEEKRIRDKPLAEKVQSLIEQAKKEI